MDNIIELLDMFSDGYNLCKDILKAKVIKI